MFSFFKSKKNKPTTIKSTYYIRESIIHTTDDLVKLLNPEIKPETLSAKSEKTISFKGLTLNDINENNLINEMEQAVYVYDNSDVIPGHRVFFYKDDVEFYRFLFQFHFIHDEFFLASNKVSASGMLSGKEKSKIVNQICGKYLNKTDVNTFLLNINDSQNNYLTTIDDVYFYVNYLCGNEIVSKLKSRYSDHVSENDKKAFDDSVDKYF